MGDQLLSSCLVQDAAEWKTKSVHARRLVSVRVIKQVLRQVGGTSRERRRDTVLVSKHKHGDEWGGSRGTRGKIIS